MNMSVKVAVFVTVASIVFTACSKPATQTSALPTPRARRADVNVNTEPLENRPFVTLSPRNDGHAVELTLLEIKKKATDVEYDIEYNSGSLLQGAFGDVDLSQGSVPYAREILLGSCSTGGKCTYNTNVTGGTVTLRFGNPDFTFKNEWSFADVNKTDKVYTSRDGKFTLDTTGAKTSATQVVVYQDPGYPGSAPGTIVAGPYTVGVNGAGISGKVMVSMRLPSNEGKYSIEAYDGKKWSELPTTTANQTASTVGPLQVLYIVIQK